MAGSERLSKTFVTGMTDFAKKCESSSRYPDFVLFLEPGIDQTGTTGTRDMTGVLSCSTPFWWTGGHLLLAARPPSYKQQSQHGELARQPNIKTGVTRLANSLLYLASACT